MPENAQVEIEDAIVIARHWDDCRREAAVREAQLVVKANSLEVSGHLLFNYDPVQILSVLENCPLESLR